MVFLNRIRINFKRAFGQGLTSCELATCLTVAVLATTFPMFGITTIVVTAIGVRLKLNLPLLILVTYSLEPLRFLIFVPLTEIGSFILDTPQELTIETVRYALSGGIVEATMFFLHQFIFAVIGWLLIVLPLAYPLFLFSKHSIGLSIPKTRQCIMSK